MFESIKITPEQKAEYEMLFPVALLLFGPPPGRYTYDMRLLAYIQTPERQSGSLTIHTRGRKVIGRLDGVRMAVACAKYDEKVGRWYLDTTGIKWSNGHALAFVVAIRLWWEDKSDGLPLE